MRISSSTIFETGVYGMEQQQSAMFTTQQQLSTGLRVYTPSIDPVAAARALEVGQSNSINTQYQTNQNAALSRLNLNEANLASVTTLIQNVQVQAVNAGNASLTVTEKQAIASQLTSLQKQLVSLANSTDGAGNYLFSGSMAGTKPFVQTQNGVQYVGDSGHQSMQITSSRQIQVSYSGADIFQNIKTGNGSFVTAAASGNTGTGVIGTGTVTDPTKWNVSGNSKNFSIKFAVSGTAPNTTTTYDLVDNSTGNSLLTGTTSASSGPYPATYTSGSSIIIGQTTATASASIAAATAADASTSAAAADTAAAGTVAGTTLNATGSEAYTAAYNAAIAGGASTADATAAATAIQSAAQAGGATATAITTAATTSVAAAVAAATGGTVTTGIATAAANAAATVIANAAAKAAGTQPATSDFGASVSITGTPANGDTFSLNQSTNESIFTTIGNLISALNSNSTGPAANAALSNQLVSIGQNLNNDLNNVLTVRAANGAWINETTTAQTTSGNLGLQYQTTISNLQDLDYTKAISKLNQETTLLQAAQKSFAQVSGLSLFNYIQ